MSTMCKEGYRGFTVWSWSNSSDYQIDTEVYDENNRYRFSQTIKSKLKYKEILVFINDLYGDKSDKYIWGKKDFKVISEKGRNISNEDIIEQLKIALKN